MAGGGTTLEYTPTWVVALVCTVIVLISLIVERILHYTGKACIHYLLLVSSVMFSYVMLVMMWISNYVAVPQEKEPESSVGGPAKDQRGYVRLFVLLRVFVSILSYMFCVIVKWWWWCRADAVGIHITAADGVPRQNRQDLHLRETGGTVAAMWCQEEEEEDE